MVVDVEQPSNRTQECILVGTRAVGAGPDTSVLSVLVGAEIGSHADQCCRRVVDVDDVVARTRGDT